VKSHDTHLADTRRRWLTAGVGLPALAWLGAVRTQANAPVAIGWLANGSRDGRDLLNAFTAGMAAPGWKLGAQCVLEERHGEGPVARLPARAQELAAMKPAVIVAWPSSAARAANNAAPTTPLVLLTGDALAAGLVTSLARPGGMITGSSNMAADTKMKTDRAAGRVGAEAAAYRVCGRIDHVRTRRQREQCSPCG